MVGTAPVVVTTGGGSIAGGGEVTAAGWVWEADGSVSEVVAGVAVAWGVGTEEDVGGMGAAEVGGGGDGSRVGAAAAEVGTVDKPATGRAKGAVGATVPEGDGERRAPGGDGVGNRTGGPAAGGGGLATPPTGAGDRAEGTPGAEIGRDRPGGCAVASGRRVADALPDAGRATTCAI